MRDDEIEVLLNVVSLYDLQLSSISKFLQFFAAFIGNFATKRLFRHTGRMKLQLFISGFFNYFELLRESHQNRWILSFGFLTRAFYIKWLFLEIFFLHSNGLLFLALYSGSLPLLLCTAPVIYLWYFPFGRDEFFYAYSLFHEICHTRALVCDYRVVSKRGFWNFLIFFMRLNL